MAAQQGRDLLLKIDADATGVFTTVAGLRSRSIALNAATVDVTNQDSAGQWRELLDGAGVRTARIAGSGVFKDAASDAVFRQSLFSGSLPRVQVVVPDFGTLEGPFLVGSYELTGRHDGEVTFDVTLESAGAISFTAL